MLANATFWVAIALLIFFALLIYMKVPGTISKSLDKRSDEIRNELDEARKLREEAASILAEYQKKRQEAEQEAESIVAQAKKDAAAMKTEELAKLSTYITRRQKQAEDKIAQAEAQAVNDVRSTSVEVAIAAAENLIGKKVNPATNSKLIEASIAELKSKLN